MGALDLASLKYDAGDSSPARIYGTPGWCGGESAVGCELDGEMGAV